MGRTYKKGGREAKYNKRPERWKRQKGQKHERPDDERDEKLPRERGFQREEFFDSNSGE